MFTGRNLCGILTSIALLMPMAQVAWSGDCGPQHPEECPTDYSMPSGSMAPTLLVGEHFFVDKQRFTTHWPELGEVVVFFPKNNKIKYLKRVVGLPGDHVQMRDGVLFINGEAVPKQRIVDFVDEKGGGSGRPIPQYIETLPNGVTYKVLDKEANGAADNTEEYVVPPGNYFMMGDNRDNALDSRYAANLTQGGAGYVPRENIIAKATSIYFSWHFSRIGMKIE